MGPNKDISNSDLEDYFGQNGTVISVSQEREKGSGYIEFGDEDPVDRAVLVGVHNIKTAVLEVIRVQKEEIRRKCEQQKPTGDQRQGSPIDRTLETPDPVFERESRASRNRIFPKPLRARTSRQQRALY